MASKMTLAEASKVMGLSVNGLRSRVKRDPALYGVERDNTGRLWVTLDPSKVDLSKGSRTLRTQDSGDASRLTLEVENAGLRSQLQEVREDRDNWRRMAETLAAKRWRFWPF